MKFTRFWETGKTIIAIGRNYKDHAKELGNEVPSAPFYFIKPTSSYLKEGPIIIPTKCSSLHYEVEIAVVIGKKGKNIPRNNAEEYIAGYALALDMTARDIQTNAKNKGLPWAEAKGYDTFCPISDFIPSNLIDINNTQFWLKVNGDIKQQGDTHDMIFKVPQLIEHISKIMTLQEADIILTGTPAGVSAVDHGKIITAGINGLPQYDMSFVVVRDN